MIPYLLHVSILLAGSFILYWILLRKETFYKLNRVFLLAAVVLSLTLPVFEMPTQFSFRTPVVETGAPVELTKSTIPAIERASSSNVKDLSNTTIPVVKQTTEAASETIIPVEEALTELTFVESMQAKISSLNLFQILWMIYLVGVGIFLITFLIQFLILIAKRSQLEYIQDGKFRIYELTDDSPPFSFLKWIFINPSLYEFETYNQIIEHEKIHVRQAHYADKMIAEFAVIFFWFNPFVWMYRKAIANNLEFLTDETMLHIGADKEEYQMNLLRVSVPQHAMNLTTNYNESFLSARIKMMNNKKSSAKSSWKYLLIFPLIALSLATLNAVQSLENDKDVLALAEADKTHDQQNSAEKEVKKVEGKNKTSTKKKKDQDSKSKEKSQAKSEKISENIKAQSEKEIPKNIEEISSIVVNAGQSGSSKGSYVSINGVELRPGFWAAQIAGDEVCFDINNSDEMRNWTWTMRECFFVNEIQGFSMGEDVSMQIKRDAGTLSFQGEMSKYSGAGTFEFRPDANFKKQLSEMGFGQPSDNEILVLFLNKTNVQFAEKLADNYDVDVLDELVVLSENGVDEEALQKYETLLKNNGIESVDVSDLIEISNQGFDEEVIEQMINQKTTKAITTTSVSDDKGGLFEALQKYGYYNFTADDVVELSIHNFESDELERFKKLGYLNLKIDDLADFAIHGVTSDYAKKMIEADLGMPSAKTLVEMKIHGVSTYFVNDLSNYIGDELQFDKVIEAKIHGMNSSFAKEMMKIFDDEADIDDLIEMKIHGVNPEYAKELQKAFANNLDPGDVVEAKIHGVKSDFAEKARNLGVTNVNIEDVVSAHIHGVSISFIKNRIRDGIKNTSLCKYTKLKIHGY